jgi:hypothetical protein
VHNFFLVSTSIDGSLVAGEGNSEDQDEIMALFRIEEDSSEDEDD